MAQSRLKADTLAFSVLMLIVFTVVQRAVGLGRSVLFCRWLAPETLGQWEMVYSFLLLAAPLAVLGVPGSFGRYLEHYRQRGHLRTFLSRTMIWTGICGTAAVVVVLSLRTQFSRLIFGTSDQADLVSGVALCLAAVILQHTLISLFNALRLFRIVSAMNFAQSLLFASLTLTLLTMQTSVSSLLIGYGAGCLVASLGAVCWAWPALRGVAPAQEWLPQTEFWPRLMRFAFYVWLTNLLIHLFAILDRYMIVHYSGLQVATALEQVGHYHSSRIIPLLLVSFAEILADLIMPHLSRDWEAGRTTQVGHQLKLYLKLTGLGLLAIGTCMLVCAPPLFDIILQGKYAQGLAVLPWTLAGCIWFSLYLVAQTYLWCAERTRLATVPLALGLVINGALNLLLLPMWGLPGAVIATGLATLACLSVTLLLSWRAGLALDRGLWIVCWAPIVLSQGAAISAVLTAGLLLITLFTPIIINRHERSQLRELAQQGLQKIHLLQNDHWPLGTSK